MDWKSPDFNDLKKVCAQARASLTLCSPFVSSPALQVVTASLQHPTEIRIWTRLSHADWLTGASDPVALAQFVERHERDSRITIRESRLLHAKVILADERAALIGSSNLTAGGFARNLEATGLLEGADVQAALPHVKWLEEQTTAVSTRDFHNFVRRCEATAADRESVLDLVRAEALEQEGQDGSLTPLRDFIRFVESSEPAFVRTEILKIFRNEDGSNRGGHLKQSYYAVQRFLLTYPNTIAATAQAPLSEQFAIPDDIETAWSTFLNQNVSESSDVYLYSFATLHHELPRSLGGTREGGGGAGYPFRLVWPYLARLLLHQH